MTANQESKNASSSFRKCSHSESEAMSAIAIDAQNMVRSAAHPVVAGETVKAQMRKAALNLRYPAGDWRVKAAWYGEAGSWGAALFRDFEERFRAWQAKQNVRANTIRSDALSSLAALRDAYASIDPEAHREQIEGIERALLAAGYQPNPVGGTSRSSESQS